MIELALANGLGGQRETLANLHRASMAERISVPVMYPSGATATVEVTHSGDHCFVSDMGLGHMEAELAAAADLYANHARQAADRFGIGYDGFSLFVMRAPLDRLTGAITVVANASAQAASATVLSASEQRETRRNDEVFDRVKAIFGPQAVERSFEVQGKTSTWEAHNVVQLSNDRRAIFEFVSDHVSSVSSKFFMFSDIAKAAGAPTRNSVIRSGFERVGSKGNALADVSNILRLDASSEQFRTYAVAA